jgi:hypothetical protein
LVLPAAALKVKADRGADDRQNDSADRAQHPIGPGLGVTRLRGWAGDIIGFVFSHPRILKAAACAAMRVQKNINPAAMKAPLLA